VCRQLQHHLPHQLCLPRAAGGLHEPREPFDGCEHSTGKGVGRWEPKHSVITVMLVMFVMLKHTRTTMLLVLVVDSPSTKQCIYS
jgi:hypothetical protein